MESVFKGVNMNTGHKDFIVVCMSCYLIQHSFSEIMPLIDSIFLAFGFFGLIGVLYRPEK